MTERALYWLQNLHWAVEGVQQFRQRILYLFTLLFRWRNPSLNPVSEGNILNQGGVPSNLWKTELNPIDAEELFIYNYHQMWNNTFSGESDWQQLVRRLSSNQVTRQQRQRGWSMQETQFRFAPEPQLLASIPDCRDEQSKREMPPAPPIIFISFAV